MEYQNKEFINKVKRSSLMKSMINSDLKEISIYRNDDDYLLKISTEKEEPIYLDFIYKPRKKELSKNIKIFKENKIDIIADLEMYLSNYINTNKEDLQKYKVEYKQYNEEIDDKILIKNDAKLINTSKNIIKRIEKYFNRKRQN